MTRAVRWRRASRAAAARLSPSCRPSAPRRRSDDDRAKTTGRPPSSAIETSIDPSTPARRLMGEAAHAATDLLPARGRRATANDTGARACGAAGAHSRFCEGPPVEFSASPGGRPTAGRRGLAEREQASSSLPFVRRPETPRGWKGRMAHQSIGLDIGTSAVRAVELIHRRGPRAGPRELRPGRPAARVRGRRRGPRPRPDCPTPSNVCGRKVGSATARCRVGVAGLRAIIREIDMPLLAARTSSTRRFGSRPTR